MSCGLHDLSSLTRDRTQAPVVKAESQPLDLQGIPSRGLDFGIALL